jgi:hypothetical protein
MIKFNSYRETFIIGSQMRGKFDMDLHTTFVEGTTFSFINLAMQDSLQMLDTTELANIMCKDLQAS